MIIPLARLCALAGLLIAAPAAAQVVITKAEVVKGNITPGDAPGFPITITRSGSYKLGGNIIVDEDGKNAFLIQAMNVTIDLNGFRLSGANRPNTRGVLGQANGLTIHNGTVDQFTRGGIISVVDSADWIVEDVRVTDNGVAGISAGAGLRVSGSTIFANDANGIEATSGSLIEDNIISLNGGVGLTLSGEGGALIGNTFERNISYAISTHAPTAGANNFLIGNNGGNAQISGSLIALQPNACVPACP